MHRSPESGFTLVELLVVIAIIGLLSTIGVVSLNSARAKARDSKRLSDVKQIAKVLEIYQSGKSEYPTGDKEPTIRVMDGGCISEGGGVAATCTGVQLLQPIPSAPNNAAGERYRYRSYLERDAPSCRRNCMRYRYRIADVPKFRNPV